MSPLKPRVRKTILIVDDEEDLRLPLQDALNDAGYAADTTDSGHEANSLVHTNAYDLIILDIELPDIEPQLNGYDLCRQWKQEGITSKVLMLTGRYQSDTATVHGFEQGADEYIVKPYNLSVLMARIKLVLHRNGQIEQDNYTIPGLCINKASREVSDGQSKYYDLTPKEYGMLVFLVSNEGRSLSYDEILKTVWGENVVVNQATINNTVHNLRKKLSIKTRQSYDVVNIHSFGFKFVVTR